MAEKFWEHLADAGFYMKAVANMGDAAGGAVLQFGTTGRGVATNYMVTSGNGIALAFRGATHEPYGGAVKRFAPRNLSEAYSRADVQGFALRSLEKLAEG
jgi:hypothetical protein